MNTPDDWSRLLNFVLFVALVAFACYLLAVPGGHDYLPGTMGPAK